MYFVQTRSLLNLSKVFCTDKKFILKLYGKYCTSREMIWNFKRQLFTYKFSMELERMRELCHPGFICKLPPDLNNSRGVEKPHRPHTDWRKRTVHCKSMLAEDKSWLISNSCGFCSKIFSDNTFDFYFSFKLIRMWIFTFFRCLQMETISRKHFNHFVLKVKVCTMCVLFKVCILFVLLLR